MRWRFTDGPPEWIGTDATFELTEDGAMAQGGRRLMT